MHYVSKTLLFVCLSVVSFAQAALGAALAHGRWSHSWQHKANAVYFYDKKAPYYEFTNFFQLESQHQLMIDGMNWRSTEHYFQAQKFTHNRAIFNQIRDANRSRDAFNTARQYAAQARPDWTTPDAHGSTPRQRAMMEALIAKFTQNEDLQRLLLGTGNKVLVEDSPIDGSWGRGQNWIGQNELGQMLMNLRDCLRVGARIVSFDMPGAIAFPDQPSLFSRFNDYFWDKISSIGNLFKNKLVNPVRGFVACAFTSLKNLSFKRRANRPAQ